MDLSIVTTLYRSGPWLREFHARVTRCADALTAHYEIVMVDDGCPADSLAVAREILAGDERVRIVELSRNFGHHQAMHAGLRHARGARVLLIDCDLEEPPEALAGFWARMDADPDLDVVYGVQPQRRGRLFDRLSGGAFDFLFNLLSKTRLPPNSLHLRLMNRAYVDAIAQLREQDLFLVGLFELVGFRQVPHPVAKTAKGESTYTLARKVRLFVASITSFSTVPLKISFFAGFAIAGIAFVYTAWLVARVLLGAEVLEGWTSIMASVWFLAGVILMAIGVLGAYVSRIYTEVKHRPTAIVRRIHARPPSS